MHLVLHGISIDVPGGIQHVFPAHILGHIAQIAFIQLSEVYGYIERYSSLTTNIGQAHG